MDEQYSGRMTRRKFLRTTAAGGAAVLAGGLPRLVSAEPTKAPFRFTGDLAVNRMGFGAMRMIGDGTH